MRARRLIAAVVVALAVGLAASALRVERWVGDGGAPRLVFDVTLPRPLLGGSSDTIAVTWRARLAGRAPSFAFADDATQGTVTVDGEAIDAEVTRRGLMQVGELALCEVMNDTATSRDWFARARAGELGPDVEGVAETWTSERTGQPLTDHYLSAPTVEALDGAVDGLIDRHPLPEDLRVVYQSVPAAAAPSGRPRYVRTHLLSAHPVLDHDDFARVEVTTDPSTSRAAVVVTLTPWARDHFSQVTAELSGKRLAFVVDGVVTDAPIIQRRVSTGQVTVPMASRDPDEARVAAIAFAQALRGGGQLPAGIDADLREARPGSTARIWLPRLGLALLGGLAGFLVAGWGGRRSGVDADHAFAPGLAGLARVALATLITLGLPTLLMVAAPRLLLPGLDGDAIDDLARSQGESAISIRAWLGIFAVTLWPMAFSFWLTEAFATATRRRIRLGTPRERRRLDLAALTLGLVIAIDEAIYRAYHLTEGLSSTVSTSLGPAGTIAILLVGFAVLVAVAELISRHGLCNGYLALLGFDFVHDLRGALTQPAARDGIDHRVALVAWVAVIALVVVVATALRDRDGERRRTPRIGIFPVIAIVVVLWLWHLGMTTGDLLGVHDLGGEWERQVTERSVWIDAAALVALTIAFLRATGLAGSRRGLALTVATLAALFLVRWLAPPAIHVEVKLIGAVLLAVLAVEVTLAIRARLGLHRPVAILAVHDVDRADRAADVLAAAGIAASVENLRARAILRGLASYAPIVIRVAAADAERAATLVAEAEAELDPRLATFAA